MTRKSLEELLKYIEELDLEKAARPKISDFLFDNESEKDKTSNTHQTKEQESPKMSVKERDIALEVSRRKKSRELTEQANELLERQKQSEKDESKKFKHNDGPFVGKYKFSLKNKKHFPNITEEDLKTVNDLMDKGYSEKEASYIAGLRPRTRSMSGNILSDEYEFSTEMPSKRLLEKLKPLAYEKIKKEKEEKIHQLSPEDSIIYSNIRDAKEIYNKHFNDLQQNIENLKNSKEFQNADLTTQMKMMKELKNKHNEHIKAKQARELRLASMEKNKDLYYAAQANKIRDLMEAGNEVIDHAVAAQSIGYKKEDGEYGLNTFGTEGKLSQKINSASDVLKQHIKMHEAKVSPEAIEAIRQKRIAEREDLHEGMTHEDRLKHYNYIVNQLEKYGLPKSYREDSLPERLPRGVKRMWEQHKNKFTPEHQAFHQKTLDYIEQGKAYKTEEPEQEEEIKKSFIFMSLEEYLQMN